MIKWETLASEDTPPFVEMVELHIAQDHIVRLCNDKNELGEDVVWRGIRYQFFPFVITDVKLSGQGSTGRPKLTLPNIENTVVTYIEEFNQLSNVKVYRRQVAATALDAINFKDGNPNVDFTQENVFEFVISRLLSYDSADEVAAFEMAAPIEMAGVTVPARVFWADTCTWTYRDENCGYTGKPMADEFDQPTTDPKKDRCSYRLKGCKIRHGDDAVYPFGGFPGIDRL